MTRQENPYVGPRSFQHNETLYGRDKEVADLVDLLVSERIVLLFSPSGAGKSSLIQAALLPALASEDFAWLGTGRLGNSTGHHGLAQDCNPYSLSFCLSLEQNLVNEQHLPLETLMRMDLSTYLGHRLKMLPASSSGLIVLDQFEEILTLNPTDTDNKAQFFQQLGKALDNHELWCLLSMREDFLAGLDPYRDLLPTRLDITYRLNLLERNAAMAAIRKPAARMGMDFQESAAASLVDNLSEIGVQMPDGTAAVQSGIYVEPVQLQVVCRRLWEDLPEGRTDIDVDDVARVGNVDQALSGYYANCVGSVAHGTGVSERIIRAWCGNALIIGNSLRGQVVRGQVSELPDSVIDGLVDTHLLRVERRRGTAWLELAHDRLVRPILADNKQWFAVNLSHLQRQVPIWDQQGRPAELLLKGKHLKEAERQLSQENEPLTPVEAEFLLRSRRLRNGKRIRLGFYLLIVLLALIAASLFIKNQEQGLKFTTDIVALKENIETKKAQIKTIETSLDNKQQELKTREAHLQSLHEGLNRSKQEIEASNQARSNLNKELVQLKEFETKTLDTLTQARAAEEQSRLAQQKAESALLKEKKELTNLAEKTQRQRRLFRALDLAARVPGLIENDKFLAGYVALEAYAAQKGLTESTLPEVDRALRAVLVALGATTSPMIAHEDEVICDMAQHPKEDILAWATNVGVLVLWHQKKDSQQRESLGQPVRSLAWSPSGKILAVGLRDAPLMLFRYQGKLSPFALEVSNHSAYALCFSSDSQFLFSGHKDGSLDVWPLGAASPPWNTRKWKANGPVFSLAISGDDQLLAIATDRLWLMPLTSNEPPRVIHEISDCVSLAWSADNRLAVGTRYQGISIISAKDPSYHVQLFATHAIVTGLAFDGNRLVSSWSDGSLRIWDEPREDLSPREIKGHNKSIVRMVAAKMPSTFFTCSVDQTLRRWSVDTESLIEPLCNSLKDAKPSEKWRNLFPDLGGYRTICPNLPSLGEAP